MDLSFDNVNLYDMTPTDKGLKGRVVKSWIQDKEERFYCTCCGRKLDVANEFHMRYSMCSKKCYAEMYDTTHLYQ